MPVVEAQPQITNHGHGPAHALHDPDDVGSLATGRHEVDDANRSVSSVPFRFQDEGVAAVAPPGACAASGRRKQPPPGLGRVEQRREAGRRVEAWHAHPIDRPLQIHQSGGVQIA
jgi:hypothetical protein